jgi:ribonuclease P protein component
VISIKNRFHGHRAVSKVRGSTIHSTSLSLRFMKTKRDDYRLAIVVSKKVAPKAVTRNRIRRRLFELMRTQKRLQGLGIDVIIYAKTDTISKMNSKTLEQEVLTVTKNALQRL